MIAVLQSHVIVVPDPLGLLAFLLVGVIAGWLAGKISKGRGFGLFRDMVIGILGAFLGGFLFQLLGITAHGFLGSLVMATIGALCLLYLVRALKKL